MGGDAMASVTAETNDVDGVSLDGFLFTPNLTEEDCGGISDFDDTSLIPYPTWALKTIPMWEFAVKITVYVIIIAMALIGNVCVVFIVWRNKRMRTTTNCYIVNLAVSDLMVTSSCSWVHLVFDVTDGWVLGAFFCKFNSFAQILSLVSSIMTLTLIACDRFFGIVFAMKAHVTERRPSCFIVLIWILAIGLSSPLLFYRQQTTREWLNHTEIFCDDIWPSTLQLPANNLSAPVRVSYVSRQVYYTFVSVVLYFIPIIVMCLAYSFIIFKLWSSRTPGERIQSEVKTQDRVKKKVVIMLIIIMSVFAICWLPFQISLLYSEHRQNKHLSLPDWFAKFQFFANFIAYANSAFNPLIYTGFNDNFRKGFKSLLCCDSEQSRRARYDTVNSNYTTHSHVAYNHYEFTSTTTKI